MAQDTTGAVKSAVRVLDLLELLDRVGEVSHSDIADSLEIPKSSLTQLLRTLVARGYVDFDPATKGYRLGAAFARFSRRTNDARDLVTFVVPVLEDLTRETGETCALNQLKGTLAEVVATVSSPQRLLSNMRTGDVAPLYATSGGKSILAFLPDDVRADYLANVVFEAITPKTIRSRKELARQVAAVRKDRIAYSFEEFTPGIVGIGVPILSAAGTQLGSLNVAMPAVRYTPATRERVTRALRQGVDRIQREFLDAGSKTKARR
jgi:DNA-binding IclR family transcriptional regulator